jgi:hypothetical protein
MQQIMVLNRIQWLIFHFPSYSNIFFFTQKNLNPKDSLTKSNSFQKGYTLGKIQRPCLIIKETDGSAAFEKVD